MRRRFWLAVDHIGHALPLWLRVGRVRYAICLCADRYYNYDDTLDMTPRHFDALADAGEPVDIEVSPDFRVVLTEGLFRVSPSTFSSSNASSVTFTYSPPKQ